VNLATLVMSAVALSGAGIALLAPLVLRLIPY
jgi:hypothetical protein